jgi:hypothetical protein
MSNLLKCRKCNGPHLTIKCGKDNNTIKDTFKDNNYIEKNNKYNNYNNNNYNNYNNNKYNNNTDKYKVYKAKVSNLPVNITFTELNELLSEWGHNIKVNVKNYNDSSIAYLEFKYEDELNYFIEALHNTPFDYQILNIIKID